MPAWMRYRGWVFSIFAGDTTLRPHVHIRKDGAELKVWLDDLSIARNRRVGSKDEKMLLRVVAEHREKFMEKFRDQIG